MYFDRVIVPEWMQPQYCEKFTYVVYFGGRNGGKTFCVADFLIIRSFQDKNCNYLCAREFQKTLDNSVYSVFVQQVDRMNLTKYFKFTVGKIINKLTGVTILFQGLWKNPNSIKGIPDLKIVWIDEASDISKPSWDVLVPTVTRNRDCQLICTLNPQFKTDIIAQEFIENNTRSNSYIKKVSYLDNPFKVSDEFLEEVDRLKARDYEAYLHVYEGAYIGNTQIKVFKKGSYWQVQEFDENAFDEIITPKFGCDFGFSKDPFFGVRMFFYNRSIYVSHEAVLLGLDVDKTPDFLRQHLPDVDENPVYCDSAAPAYISALKQKGLHAIGAQKGRGSVEDGIRFLKAHEMIYIHPRCKRLIENFEMYSYKLDRAGDITRALEDKYNDGIDALRYAVETTMIATYDSNYKKWNI
jgi:phage terminase large subunit